MECKLIIHESNDQPFSGFVYRKRRAKLRAGSLIKESLHPERQSLSSAYSDLESTVKLLPIESQTGPCCTMPIVVVRVQVLAGGRDRFMSQVVPHVSQIDLLNAANARLAGLGQAHLAQSPHRQNMLTR
jgi:hypothetical protein